MGCGESRVCVGEPCWQGRESCGREDRPSSPMEAMWKEGLGPRRGKVSGEQEQSTRGLGCLVSWALAGEGQAAGEHPWEAAVEAGLSASAGAPQDRSAAREGQQALRFKQSKEAVTGIWEYLLLRTGNAQ